MYVSRNSDSYDFGRMVLSFNKAYRNGINGVVVHKTTRVRVEGNIVWDNGQVSKDAPASRQPYAGVTLNHATDVSLVGNRVAITNPVDSGFVLQSGSSFIENETGNNTICNGLMDATYGERVTLLGEGCALDLSEASSYLEGEVNHFVSAVGTCGV